LLILLLALAALSHRALLGLGGQQGNLSRELEEWFFLAAETSPLVIVLLVSWLLYRRKERIAQLAAQPVAWGFALSFAVLGAAIFVWSLLTGAVYLQALSLLLCGLAVVAVLYGREGLRIASLPALLLVFAVPIPAPLLSALVYKFQIWTAEYAGWLLFFLGKSAFVSGDQVLLAEDHFAVIEGCSGMRSVQTLTMVALLLVELFGRRGWHALAILGLAPIVAFALNGFRVLALILNPLSEVVAIHNLQGVAILIGGLVVLYLLDGVFERLGSSERTPLPEDAGPPLVKGRVIGCAAGLGALALASFVASPWQGAKVATPLEEASFAKLSEWSYETLNTDESFLGTVGYTSLIDRRYRQGSQEVELFLMTGELSNNRRTLISPKTIRPGSGWIIEERAELPPRSEGARASRSYVMRSGTRRVLVRHWYEGTQGLTSETLRSLLAIDASPWHRDSNTMVIRLTTDVRGIGPVALQSAGKLMDRFERDLERDLELLRTELGEV